MKSYLIACKDIEEFKMCANDYFFIHLINGYRAPWVHCFFFLVWICTTWWILWFLGIFFAIIRNKRIELATSGPRHFLRSPVVASVFAKMLKLTFYDIRHLMLINAENLANQRTWRIWKKKKETCRATYDSHFGFFFKNS